MCYTITSVPAGSVKSTEFILPSLSNCDSTILRCTFLFVALLAISTQISGAESLSVTGRVLDPKGAPIAGAHVRLFVAGTVFGHEDISDPDGIFTLRNVEPGLYQIQAD